MKIRILALLTALAMLLGIVPALADGVTGTFEGKGTSTIGGELTVAVTFENSVITKVEVTQHNETPGIGTIAIDQLPGTIVENNSLAVDTITGATETTKAIVEACRAAVTAAGLDPDDYMGEIAKTTAGDAAYDTDIVIVGAGGAGMVAAITAADAGAKVVLVESQPLVGGNSVRATGGMNAAKTALQDANTFGENAGVETVLKNAGNYAENAAITELAATVKTQWDAWQADPVGYFDSVELMQLDTLIGGKGINDPALVATLVMGTEPAIEWLKTVDIDLSSVGAFGGASVKRIHRPVDENGKTLSVGAYMIPRLEEAVKARENITLLTETTATKIVTDESGAAVGIVATGKDGNTVTVNAKAVVLTTGGFGANPEMVVQYAPHLEGFMSTNAAGAQGQGILMATAIGASTVDLDQVQIHPTVQADTAALITEGLRGDGAILVNSEGKRFIDEVGTRDVVSAAEIAQPGSFSWLIVDQRMLDASTVIQGYVKRGFTFSGNTYEELAEAIGVPADVFAATMNDWNSKVEAKSDPDFNRVSFANPLDTAPFYAIKVTAGIHHTMGGLAIDPQARVLSGTEPIPGLFAAGEVTGGVHGANRLGGNAVADFVVFGRIAGQNAAEYAAK